MDEHHLQAIPHSGRLLIIGCGSVSRCLQPLLLRHVQMDFRRLAVMDIEDLAGTIPETLASGASFVKARITPDTMDELLGAQVGPGDVLLDLAWNIDCRAIVSWCHDHGVLYLNTSVELWDPYEDATTRSPQDRSLYVRHMALRDLVAAWPEPGPTAVVEHGANPGLVSHWTKAGLVDIATAMLFDDGMEPARRAQLEQALSDRAWAQIAEATGLKTIHISERDTQISSQPKRVGEFVNTWSVEGFYEEGIAPAELGWGTHERTLPPDAHTHADGPGNQICLARMGMETSVRSWVPLGGEIIGMVVRHGEAFTISDRLTVWDGDRARYRPTVHYAYLPTDAAMASLHELRMTGLRLQEQQRIMDGDIVSGIDELGVLLLGHDLGGWWVGSQLGIEEARRLVPGQNATTLQVAASILGALAWMLENPDRGLLVPDDLDHEDVLRVAGPYLGPCPSLQTDWTPLANRVDPFENFGRPRPDADDVWQFQTFRVP